jgi:FdhD protein
MTTREPGMVPHRYWVVRGEQIQPEDGGVIEEGLVSIYVNGQQLVTVMCSPLDQEALTLGFLRNEGIITSLDEVGVLKANVARTVVDVLLHRGDFTPPRHVVLTAGCGMGVTLRQLTGEYPALDSALHTTPDVIVARMRDLHGTAHLYHRVRGVHTAVLTDLEHVLVSAEDVGRHNAIDKIAGKALLAGIDTRDTLMLTTGRISSEMLTKARRMNVPIVASRTAPTSTAVELAEAWSMCVIGYVRQGGLRVYTHPERLGLPDLPPDAPQRVTVRAEADL